MPDPNTSGSEEVPVFSPTLQHYGTVGAAPRATGEATSTAVGDHPASASVVEQGKQRLTGALDAQKRAAADKVEELAQALHRSAEQFQGKQDWIASAIGRGAAELNTLAGSLRQKDVGDLLGQVQSFVGRQPALFAGAAFAAGFAVARVGRLVAGELSRDDLPTVPEVGHGQR